MAIEILDLCLLFRVVSVFRGRLVIAKYSITTSYSNYAAFLLAKSVPIDYNY